MSTALRIDFVAPPFAGHLFPLLDLASSLRDEGFRNLRILSTATAREAIQLCRLPHLPLLPGLEAQVEAIANTERRVSTHPLRLYRQFQANLGLKARLRAQLQTEWQVNRPDLVLTDFTVPVAGLLAREMGIPWWTSLPSPCALETSRGVPGYLGGWRPKNHLLGRLRDALGRRAVRLFKQGIATLFRRELRELAITGVYRADGSEVLYSPECILALGMREFEFDRDWPAVLHFIGPLTGTPPFPCSEPEFPEQGPCVLVSLGTHLPWARQTALALLEQVAALMPDCVFHFTQGIPGSTDRSRHRNLHLVGFLPYDRYLPRYDAALVHGGTGVTYSCLRAGVPMLVWPHDYDQFDHAARIVEHGLGLRLRPRPRDVVRDLRQLMTDTALHARIESFRQLADSYDARGWVLRTLRQSSTVAGTDEQGDRP